MSFRTTSKPRRRGPLLRLTPEESFNKWTPELLEKYLRQCWDEDVEFLREISCRAQGYLWEARKALKALERYHDEAEDDPAYRERHAAALEEVVQAEFDLTATRGDLAKAEAEARVQEMT